ncbi:MAG: hypothetical protein Q9208_006487 [Pyrenodesmia sp. 3 TL-2023]
MATTTASTRSLQSFVLLLISALLLIFSSYRGLPALNHASIEEVFTHNQGFHETPLVFNAQNRLTKDFAPALGDRHIDINASSSHVSSTRRHGQVKRARPIDFEKEFQAAKDQGVIALAEIEAAFTGVCNKPPTKDFEPKELDNGWSRTDGKNKGYSPSWDTAFAKLLGRARIPTEQQSIYSVQYQDRTFINSEGGGRAFQDQAFYKQYYIPSISAIIAADINSPANQVRKRFRSMRQDPPTSKAINDKWVPPLNRWSDVTWTIWKELAKDDHKKLRFIAHDNTANLQTEHVMENIFTKHAKQDAGSGSSPGSSSASGSGSGSGSNSGSSSGSSSGGSSSDADEPDFPGLSFGMDSDEGKALLGTPNGIGTARLLIDRAAALGRRELKVYIFARESDGKYCMLWDMHPPGQPSMPDKDRKKHRVRGHRFRPRL